MVVVVFVVVGPAGCVGGDDGPIYVAVLVE